MGRYLSPLTNIADNLPPKDKNGIRCTVPSTTFHSAPGTS